MLITTIVLGSTIFGATAIAGLLMSYQIRQTGDFASSARAVSAADSGIEWALYQWARNVNLAPLIFTNGAAVSVTCFDASQNTVACASGAAKTVKSVGTSGNTSRAFQVTL